MDGVPMGRMLMMLTASSPYTAKITENDATNVHADCAIKVSLGLQDDGSIEELLIEISEIHPVLVEIGEPLWFVPNDLHGLFCSYKIVRRQGLTNGWKLGRCGISGEHQLRLAMRHHGGDGA